MSEYRLARLSAPTSGALLVVALLMTSGCDRSNPVATDDCPEGALIPSLSALGPSPFDPLFHAAEEEFGVPATLLRSIGWTETRLQMVEGHEEFPGMPAAYGVMALRGERLVRGAELAEISIEHARSDPQGNIRAAAALLADYAGAGVAGRSDPSAWETAIERFSGIDLEEGQRAYIEAVMAPRIPGVARTLTATGCPATSPPTVSESPEPVWRPSPNFNARASDPSGEIRKVIVHTCEGGYVGCWSWLRNPDSRVSAHYVIDEEGYEVSKLVREQGRAWHIGANYDCTLNHRAGCDLAGVQSNHFTVGVEHAGFASQNSFPASQIETSARLVCRITERHDIPRDPHHIVAHGRLQPWNRHDPGEGWPWAEYLSRIQRHCGEIVVDDHPQENHPPATRAEIPAAWQISHQTPGYYGRGYRWASMAEDAEDAAVFSFHLESATRLEVELRWTAGENRSPRVPVTVRDGEGRVVGEKTVDQRADGGEWRSLGRYSFRSGWNRIEVSRRGPAGTVVIADAVRVR